MRTERIIVGISIFVLFALLFGISFVTHNIAAENHTVNKSVPDNIIAREDPFASLNLTAQSAYVFDTVRGEAIYARNSSAVLPLASLTKIMTAIVAREVPLAEQILVTIPPEAIKQEGDDFLRVYEIWRLPSLLKFLLTKSSNDAARAVSDGLGDLFTLSSAPLDSPREYFISAMNEKARELGLTHMRFLNETGLDISKYESGAYATAEEVALLMAYAVKNHYDIFSATRHPSYRTISESGITHDVKNTNVTAPSTTRLLASKTGYTDLAGGNLAVAFDIGLGYPVVAVVLGSTIEDRFTDIEQLINATYIAHIK